MTKTNYLNINLTIRVSCANIEKKKNTLCRVKQYDSAMRLITEIYVFSSVCRDGVKKKNNLKRKKRSHNNSNNNPTRRAKWYSVNPIR